MSTHVWKAGTDEVDAVTRLMVGFRDHLGKDWPPEEAFRGGVESLLADAQTDFLLGAPEAGAPPEGICQLRFRPSLWKAGIDCLLEDLFVTEAARGTGLGRALVAAAREQAIEHGAGRMELDVNERNAPALALYGSFGFEGGNPAFDGGRDLYLQVDLPRD